MDDVIEVVDYHLKLLNVLLLLSDLASILCLYVIKLGCQPSNRKHSPDPGSLPKLSKTNSLISLRTDPLNLCYGYIPLNNSTDKLPLMSFQGCHIITYLILSCSNCPSVPAHTSSHPVLCSLCSLELLHIADIAILARVKHLHNIIHGTHSSITASCSLTKALLPG